MDAQDEAKQDDQKFSLADVQKAADEAIATKKGEVGILGENKTTECIECGIWVAQKIIEALSKK